MAPAANEMRESRFEGLGALLASYPGRLDFAARLALVCALTTLVAEIYQTPEPALTAYVAFFVVKPDRAASVVTSIVMLLLITLVTGFTLVVTVQVIEQPIWRVTAMVLVSFCLTFAASASKLKPVAGTVALITAYALDVLGNVPGGEAATRGLLYVWLFVGIPAGVSIVVNLVLGPAPRRLAERALAHRLRLAGAMLCAPSAHARRAFEGGLHEGTDEIPGWLRLAGLEKTSSPQDIAALHQAAQSTGVMLSVVDFVMSDPKPALPAPIRERIGRTLGDMATILDKGGHPVDVTLEKRDDEVELTPPGTAALAELRAAVSAFAEPPLPDPSLPQASKARGGFFLPDAFTNQAHVLYALKTTGAAMFCYLAYLLLDWPGIHTCLITCYIVALGTTAETVEKQTLRFLGCAVGAAVGIAAIVFLMPNVTSIGGLMAVVFMAALAAGWIAAGSPRISYVGFQFAFAFFLSVVQGAAPAFDMTVARDRSIGILFGDLVVAIVFTLVSPVGVGDRVDPAITVVFRRLAALASAGSRGKRWTLAAEVRTKLCSIQQDLELTHYEPASIRPAEAWLDQRRQVTRTLWSLQGPLLISVDPDPTVSEDVARRLDQLADSFSAAPEAVASAPETRAVDPIFDRPPGSNHSAYSATIELHLAELEQLAPQRSGGEEKGSTDYVPA
jgi:multidrug resistance protein MdtO